MSSAQASPAISAPCGDGYRFIFHTPKYRHRPTTAVDTDVVAI
ncbi:MAG: hypothetical protein R3E97_24180 [Candidatus Eisenbacteria bacterium]